MVNIYNLILFIACKQTNVWESSKDYLMVAKTFANMKTVGVLLSKVKKLVTDQKKNLYYKSEKFRVFI